MQNLILYNFNMDKFCNMFLILSVSEMLWH